MCYKIIGYLSYTTYTNNHINFTFCYESFLCTILCIVSKLLAVNSTK